MPEEKTKKKTMTDARWEGLRKKHGAFVKKDKARAFQLASNDDLYNLAKSRGFEGKKDDRAGIIDALS